MLLLVLDSCGCGGAADAAAYGDAGADTLGHTAAAVGGLSLPTLETLGLGRIAAIEGVAACAQPQAAFGRLQPRAAGKDTTTGHWELAGLVLEQPFRTFPTGFSRELIDAFARATGRPVLGNKPASGTEIIEELGPQQLATGAWIVYTSADSVFQLAAHEDKIPLAELYAACETARRLCDPLQVGRVIARPYVGTPGHFVRTYNRHDYGMPPPAPTVLEALARAGVPVVGVGKIGDIFSGRGLSASWRTAGNRDGLAQTLTQLRALERGLIFVNLIDFDALYGHRRDAAGFATALRELDAALPAIIAETGPEDLLLLTADHGNDPTWPGSDHTREDVPLLAFTERAPSAQQADLGVRDGFFDVAQTLCDAFALPAWPRGKSVLPHLLPS